jgi:hypothetical protein
MEDLMDSEIQIPSEMWMLWRVGYKGYDHGFVRTPDWASGMNCHLVFDSKESAILSAKARNECYNIEFHPVRVCTIRGDDLS